MLFSHQECFIVYSRLLLGMHTICFHQECLVVYSRLLLDVHVIVLPGMSYSLFDIAFRSE